MHIDILQKTSNFECKTAKDPPTPPHPQHSVWSKKKNNNNKITAAAAVKPIDRWCAAHVTNIKYNHIFDVSWFLSV